mmetsp:Transcript_19556/g.28442  ORF Transcript_19556/g.28442 Transcript_19556/m.28442 type:complete len:136 (+) Transcript_19556:196-603(+)
MTKLEFADLSENSLNGMIPIDFFSIPNLEILYLSNNTLTGNIPDQISNAPSLRDLYLDGNALDGAIPDIPIDTLQTLEEFLINHNGITGTMPASICILRNDTINPGNLISLWADCGIPPDPPQLDCVCCTKCFSG